MKNAALSALEALRQRFLVRAGEDLAAIRKAHDGKIDDERAFCARIHQLAGAAGTFGFGKVSEAALVIDDQLSAGGSASAADLQRLADALEAIVSSSPKREFMELGA